MIRFLTAGESHGKALTVIIEGMPAHIPISQEQIAAEMRKRMVGAGSGGRMLVEEDDVEILSGIRFGQTIGSPISLMIKNKDFANWGDKMSADRQPDEVVDSARVTRPRPGHADLPGVQKYGFDDVRNVLERASARETAARVAAGAIFKQFLATKQIEIVSHSIQIGSVKLESKYTFSEIRKVYETDSLTRCVDSITARNMQAEIELARKEKNTLGGIIEVVAVNVPAGLGSYVHWDRKIDGQIAQALMSIPSVKAVEIGQGVRNSAQRGSMVHDEIYHNQKVGYYRKTNRAGGVEGGVTNGMPIVVRVYLKPISTLYTPLKTVDIRTKQPAVATVERSDICVVPRGGVVAEAMLAYVLTNCILSGN